MSSFTTAHLCKSFSFINSSQRLNFNHFQKQPPEMFHKAIVKHFVIFTGKHPWWGLFFNKVEGHQTCGIITKRLQYRYFLVNFGKFIKAPILKNINEQLHFWKVFCENIFSDQPEELLMNCCIKEWFAQISQDWTKMFPITKYKVRTEKTEFL